MKKILIILSAVTLFGLVAIENALAADAPTIKVGILLPLTGTFAAVAETQRDGALLAIDVVNSHGGLKMPGGKVRVEGVVGDDEAKQDVGVRRFRYMVDDGVKGLGGQTFAPLAYAINAMVSKNPLPYFPICVMSKEAFQKGKLAETTFATAYSPWTVGYMAGQAAIKTLGKKKIFFLARADSFGWDIRDGVYAAAKEFGGEIVGYDEVSLGTPDFTTVLQKVRAAKPDVFIASQFAADAVALLKQSQQALEGVYAMHYFYYDLASFPDKEVAKQAKDFTDLYRAKYGRPPDAYAAIAYIAYMEMFRGFETAQSYDPLKVSAAILQNGGKFNTMIKGTANWREDHAAEYKYAAFLVKGKGAKEQKNEWDLFSVIGSAGGSQVMPPLKSLGY